MHGAREFVATGILPVRNLNPLHDRPETCLTWIIWYIGGGPLAASLPSVIPLYSCDAMKLIPDILRLCALLVAAGALQTHGLTASEEDTSPSIDFNRDIRPLLSDKCFYCHGPDSAHRQADLRLDLEAEAKDYAIVEGMPEESEFYSRITSDDADSRMPPVSSGKELDDEAIQLLRRWIEQGAEYDAFWAYVPPKRHPVPKANDTEWPANWIDEFVLSRLNAEGLTPSADADRVTLIRRLSFDLTGLSPTPEEVKGFVADVDEDAYESVVDRLLASPRYGERMAMYWLDLVRYADTVGYHGDQDHSISPYRDYVINAFNDNLPLDQFTREQLAGDLLPDASIDQKIATGYNRLLQTSHEGGVQPQEYLTIYAADRVRNVSSVWMGATMGCCQCHDHKFDPYTTADFYSMVAFFADIDEARHFSQGTNALPTARPPEISVLTKFQRQEIAELERRKSDIQKNDGRDSEERERELKEIDQKVQQIQKMARRTMITVAVEPRTIRVLPRGNWLDNSGPVVEPAIPAFMGQLDIGGRRATRADLADWLTDVERGVGGLTARVFANRFWYLLFGVGISRSLDDLGGQGEPPVHPELLDNLAVEFYQSGWNVKHLMKTILMSRAYRQSSMDSPELRARDPYNRLYARQSRFRLPAEMIRDSELAIAGLLVEETGGASVKPYQPAGYYRHLNFPQRKYEAHTDHRQWRRGVYVHWQRQFLHPMLKALDAPTREECTAERPRSNTPLAALTLLNDPTFVEAARVFAARIVEDGGETDSQRLEFAFLQAVSRKPDRIEHQVLKRLLHDSREQYRENPEEAKKLIRTGLTPAVEQIEAVELASWTAVARAVLNMNETITRN
jgi:hypothetical protein